MNPRVCCVCQKETCVAVVSFPLLREGYPVGADCQASWRQEAQSLGPDLCNPSKVRGAFERWMAAREKVAA